LEVASLEIGGKPVKDDAMKQFRISDFDRRIERNSLEEE
jgi:hypothetical protein